MENVVVILNVEQQEQVKKLALPVFREIEKLLQDIKNQKTYTNIKEAVADLNKTMFCYKDNKPTWNVADIQKALNKLIHSIPLSKRALIPYGDLQKYLKTFNGPDLLDKIKQAFNNIGKGTKLRVF